MANGSAASDLGPLAVEPGLHADFVPRSKRAVAVQSLAERPKRLGLRPPIVVVTAVRTVHVPDAAPRLGAARGPGCEDGRQREHNEGPERPAHDTA
jgi:hypothetical protein